MVYGYARCSTNESKQDINRQVRELKDAGAEKIFLEYEHRDSLIKKELELLFSIVAAGDTIVVTEVTRLAGSTKQLCEVLDRTKEKKIKLIIKNSLTLDCTGGQADPMSEAFLQMAGVFSQLELAIIRARVKSGMANAKAKGAKIGRPQVSKDDIPTTFLRHYPAYKSKQLNVSELARVCDISRTTAYKYIGLLEA
jgi:DNA invertase Pin-like site-specific DNA recombinase